MELGGCKELRVKVLAPVWSPQGWGKKKKRKKRVIDQTMILIFPETKTGTKQGNLWKYWFQNERWLLFFWSKIKHNIKICFINIQEKGQKFCCGTSCICLCAAREAASCDCRGEPAPTRISISLLFAAQELAAMLGSCCDVQVTDTAFRTS